MRRLSAVVTSLALVPVLAGVSACSGSAPVPPAAASVSKQAGAAEGGSGLGPGQLATFVLEGVLQGVGAQGYMFLSDLLSGDSSGVTDKATADKLDSIDNQLTNIKARLDSVDSDLNGITQKLSGDELNTALRQFNTSSNNVLPLYQEKFRPILAETKKVAAAKEDIEVKKTTCATATSTVTPSATPATSAPTATGTSSATARDVCTIDMPTLTDALTKAVSDLDGAKAKFQSAFEGSTIFSDYLNQHDLLYPKQAGLYSVLYLAGQSLEGKGYVTWSDSQKLHQLYLTLSDQEALSALLVLEYDKMFDTGRLEEHKQGYQDNHSIEVANLAPEIPWGQVKVGNQMFQVPWDKSVGNFPSGAWLPISPEGKQLGTWFPTSVLDQNPGWSLPDSTQMTTLFEKTKNVPPTSEGKTHLGSIWANSGKGAFDQVQMGGIWGRTWYWTKDMSDSNSMACYTAFGGEKGPLRVYKLHHVANMSGDTAAGSPTPANAIELQGQPGRIPDQSGVFNNKQVMKQVECDQEMDQYNNEKYSADVLLTRPIDPATEDFMAQRQTPR